MESSASRQSQLRSGQWLAESARHREFAELKSRLYNRSITAVAEVDRVRIHHGPDIERLQVELKLRGTIKN